MLPGMRFYIASIVAIFIALGIGIYIGFAMDTEKFVLDQKENLINILELQFENLTRENSIIKKENKDLKLSNDIKDEYIESSYNYIIGNRLNDIRIGIIETNPDYIVSSIGKELERAGARTINLTTLNKSIINEDGLDNLIKDIIESIIYGRENENLKMWKDQGYIDYIGNYSEPIDYLIISGGSMNNSLDRINKIDKTIINLSKRHKVPIIGIEKSGVIYSYMEKYKEFNITTIDNVDTTIGKIAVILAMEGRPGNYGIKPHAEGIVPLDIGY